MSFTGPSASDADALKASRRGGVLLLIAVAVGGVAAAVGTATLEEGQGLDEEPGRVMLVLDGQSDAPAALLRRGGFEVRSDTLEGWGVRAVDTLEPERLEGLSAEQRVIALADELGVGHVVFESPGARDFDGIEVDTLPDGIEAARWAAFSVGDFVSIDEGVPRVTLSAPPSPVVRAEGIGAMQALYAQDRLHPERELLTHNPDIFEIQFQERISPGLSQVQWVGSLEELAGRVQREVAERLDEAGVTAIPPREDAEEDADAGIASGHAGGVVPLADGAALVVSRAVSLQSHDAMRLDYRLGDTLMLDRWRPEEAAEPATSGEHAALRVSGQPLVRVSERGDAWVTDTRFDPPRVYGAALPKAAASSEAEGAGSEAAMEAKGYRLRGKLAAVAEDERGLGEPWADGRLARVASDGASAWIRVYAPGRREAEVEAPPLPGFELHDLRWIDGEHLVARARSLSPAEDDHVVGLDLGDPEHWYLAPTPEAWRVADAPARGIRLLQLAVGVEAPGARAGSVALRVDAGDGARVIRVKLPEDWRSTGRVEDPLLFPLDVAYHELGARIEAEAIGYWGRPDGSLVTWAEATELGSRVMARTCRPPEGDTQARSGDPTEGGGWTCEERPLTEGRAIRDAKPRPLRDASGVVFTSEVPVSVTDRKVARPRYVPL